MHEGLRAYYYPSSWGHRSLQEFNARHAFKQTYAELVQKVKVGDLELEMQFEDAVTMGLRMLEFYFSWAPKHDSFWRPIFTEIEFEVRIPGTDWPYQGRIDLVVELFDDEGNSLGYWIVDHKTAKSFGELSWLTLDDQCASYAWALQKMLDIDIRGVIYNQLKKSPPHPPKQLKNGGFSVAKNQDTSFEVYLRTLREHNLNPSAYREFLSFLKHNPKEYVRRTSVSYTPRMLEVVERRIIQEAREMANPHVQIYPTPSQWNCNGCRFFGPCLQVNEGSEPSMDMYMRRSA